MKKTFKEIDGCSYPYLLHLDNSNSLKNNHWLLELHVQNKQAALELADRFKWQCYEMPKCLNWFHQGGCFPDNTSTHWHMFEFWSNDESAILHACMTVAVELGLELQLGAINKELIKFIYEI